VKVFFRYTVSGLMAAIAHFTVLWILVEWFGVYPTYASAIGFCVAMFVNYSLQYYWTFRAKGPHGLLFSRYVIVTLSMLGVNTLIFWTLNEVAGIYYLAAQLVATGGVMILNFTINRHYTFVYTSPLQVVKHE
jgi:putative flippase GtrA